MSETFGKNLATDIVHINCSWGISRSEPRIVAPDPNNDPHMLRLQFDGFPSAQHAHEFLKLMNHLIQQVDFRKFLAGGKAIQ